MVKDDKAFITRILKTIGDRVTWITKKIESYEHPDTLPYGPNENQVWVNRRNEKDGYLTCAIMNKTDACLTEMGTDPATMMPHTGGPNMDGSSTGGHTHDATATGGPSSGSSTGGSTTGPATGGSTTGGSTTGGSTTGGSTTGGSTTRRRLQTTDEP